MEVTFTIILICIAAFFVAGFIDSIAGGAGFITVPSLLLCGVPPHLALGTGKLATSIGSLAAIWTFWRGNLILMRAVPLGIASSMAGSITGGNLALLVPAEMMGKIIIIMLPLAILLTIFSGGFKLSEGELPKKGFWLRIGLIGAIVGLYEGFFGPGAGTFYLIALHVFMKMGMVHASATSKVFNLAANFGAFLAFAAGGSVLYSIAIPCAVSSMIGNRVGAYYAIKIGGKFVRNILYVVLVLLVGSLVYRYF